MTPTTRVKICGLKRPLEAEACARAGVDYVGVVFAERLRRLTPEEAARIAASAGPSRVVGVFVDEPPERILAIRDRVGLAVAQLHGSEAPEVADALRAAGLEVWKAIRPTSAGALMEGWDRYAGAADAILVEGFSSSAAGGTGSGFPHDWLDGLERATGPDLVLAGGLDARNVSAAIRHARPDVVDVSSGVESEPGRKSLDRIDAFVAAVRATGRGRTPEDMERETV